MAKQLCDAQKLFFQGYNLEVHDVIKYTRVQRKHRATVTNITCKPGFCVTQ